MSRRKRWLGLPVVLPFMLAAAGCGTTSAAESNNAASAQQVSSSTDNSSAAASTATWTIYVFRGAERVLGPDKNGHDAFVPSSVVVKKGEATTITFINEDEGPHTMTSPDLGVNITIKPGSQNADGSVTPVATTATITATKTGVFRWYCAIPCDAGHGGWAMTSDWDGMDRDGFMAGYIVVV